MNSFLVDTALKQGVLLHAKSALLQINFFSSLRPCPLDSRLYQGSSFEKALKQYQTAKAAKQGLQIFRDDFRTAPI